MRESQKLSHEKKVHEDYYTTDQNTHSMRYQWYVKKFFMNVHSKKILEIGCGDGGVINFLKETNEVHSVDISASAVSQLKKKGIPAKQVDISNESLPYKKATFDYVIILETLEHLKSPHHAIEEIQRVLKERGMMICSVPNPRTEHPLMYPALFTFKNFKKYLENSGFTIQTATTYGICPPMWRVLRHRITKNWKAEKNKIAPITDLKKEASQPLPLLTRIARIASTDAFSMIKPTFLGWSFVYAGINSDAHGAKKLYETIANETKGAY